MKPAACSIMRHEIAHGTIIALRPLD